MLLFLFANGVFPTTAIIDNQPVMVNDKVKFLDNFLDSKLSGINHLSRACSKAAKNINIMRLSGLMWVYMLIVINYFIMSLFEDILTMVPLSWNRVVNWT